MASDVNITSETTRDYYDNFSVKDYNINEIVPKFFEEDLEDLSYLNVGLQGMVTEHIAQISEDAFNTASVLMRESFPIRAQIPESIYSHAAVFQLTDIFGTAGHGKFYMMLDRANLIDNFITRNGTNYFYIDKDTMVYVDGIPFTLDYDIEIKAIKRQYLTDTNRSTRLSERYVFSVRYMTEEYTNSLSDINTPYIRIMEKNGTSDALILSLTMRQCIRTVIYAPITTNNVVNYPVIDVPFSGTLAGFDILYRRPDETEFTTQLEKRVAYSLPTKTPFCYYRLKDEETLQLFFTTRDTYFQPAYNSELKIILYTTLGEKGNFTSYSGDDILVRTTTDRYSSNVSFAVSARPDGGVVDGKDKVTLEALQAYTVEGFSTATALTTEPDLEIHFRNYYYRYGVNITWVKKRDDVRERLYGAWIVMRQAEKIFHTNTLHFRLNLDEMTLTADKRYVLEPGHLFKYVEGSTDTVELYKNPDKHAALYAEYEEYIISNPYRYDEETDATLPDYMKGPIRFEEWIQTVKKERDDYLVTDSEITSYIGKTDNPHESFKDFLYANPFLILFNKDPNQIGMYLTQVSQKKELDFMWQNDNAFIQWNILNIEVTRIIEAKKRYHITLQTTATIDVDYVLGEAVDSSTYGSREHLDLNSLRIFITILDNDREVCYTELIPTQKPRDGIYDFETYLYTDDHITSNSKIRILDTDDGETIGTGVIGNTGFLDDILIPIDDVEIRVYPMYNRHFDDTGTSVAEPIFKKDIPSLEGYYPTNLYSTMNDRLTFIKPLNNVRCHLAFEDYVNADFNVGDCVIRSVPFVKYDLLDKTTHEEEWTFFLDQFLTHYNYMDTIIETRLRNASHIDMKFYNSYGKSKNYLIGEEEESELIDTVNPSIHFDIWVKATTDVVTTERELKVAIKDYIETINERSGSNLYISNMTNYLEDNYPAVDHMRFRGIGEYDVIHQAIKNITKDVNTMDRDSRRYYVPEILNVDLDHIYLTIYTAE